VKLLAANPSSTLSPGLDGGESRELELLHLTKTKSALICYGLMVQVVDKIISVLC